MKRRNFIQATGAAVFGSRVSASTAGAATETGSSKRKKPTICFYHDARHALMYMYEPPMHKEEYETAVDELVGTPIEAIMFGLGDGRTLLHDTKVGEKWGHWVKKWPGSPLYRRVRRTLLQMIKEGNDPLRVVCERAHARGLMVYPTLFINQRTGHPETDVRSSQFRFNNRHLEIGAGGGVAPDFPGFHGLDFKHQEVRDERFAVIEEVLKNYPVDGFELQLHYMSYYFRPDEVEAGRTIMTDWMAKIHQAVKDSGSDRELAVRISADLDECHERGLDVREWMKRGIVDVAIGRTRTGTQLIDQTMDVHAMVEAAKGTSCRVLVSLQHLVDSDRLLDSPIEPTRAAACNYWAQGIDGLLLDQWFVMWPYGGEFYEQVREVAYPDIMAARDKQYFLPTIGVEYTEPRPGFQLPIDLELNRPAKVEWTITDDLPHWHKKGRVHEVILRSRLIYCTELDRVEFRLNGRPLPDSLLRKINRMYKMSAPRYRVFGYWFIFKLDPKHWPKQGKNTLEVTVRKRDPDTEPLLTLRDVEMEIKYLMGKNSYRGQDPDLGRYECSIQSRLSQLPPDGDDA